MKRIVWGTCWFNESIDILIKFYINSLASLKKMNYDAIPIIFDAKYNHNRDEIEYIKSQIKNVIIIENKVDAFPNKNYGVALITELSFKLNIDYVAIVDSDWDIEDNCSFVQTIFATLINNDADIVIPNIGEAAGRSNILVGKTAISLFYPEYDELLETVFPGSVIAKTSSLYKIVTNNSYHFDWGGEWDIFSLAVKEKMKIRSSLVNTKNIRHRLNNSKMGDSFQIWRSILWNDDIMNRLNYLNFKKEVVPYNELSKQILSRNYTINELIALIEKNGNSETERQILYMILYPIAFLAGKIDEVKINEIENKYLYDKNELHKISDLAIYCAQIALNDCDISEIRLFDKKVNGNFLGDWDFELQEQAKKMSDNI